MHANTKPIKLNAISTLLISLHPNFSCSASFTLLNYCKSYYLRSYPASPRLRGVQRHPWRRKSSGGGQK